jgi:hypothetical protein
LAFVTRKSTTCHDHVPNPRQGAINGLAYLTAAADILSQWQAGRARLDLYRPEANLCSHGIIPANIAFASFLLPHTVSFLLLHIDPQPYHHLKIMEQDIPKSSAARSAEYEQNSQRQCHRGETYTGSQAQREWILDNLPEPAKVRLYQLEDMLTNVDDMEDRGRFRTLSGTGGINNDGWEEHASRQDSGLAGGRTTQHSYTAAEGTIARGPILAALEQFAVEQWNIIQGLSACPTHGTACSHMASTLAASTGASQDEHTSTAPTGTGQ